MSSSLRFASAGLILLASSLLGACSAFVNADPADLPPVPGVDGGGGGTDSGGGGTDGGGGGTDGGGGGGDGGDPCAGGCDDGIACTVDACGASGCTHTPDDGACSGGRCNVILGCVPRLCTDDASCSNGIFCDGAERCAASDPAADPATGCVAGRPPSCFDDFSCTADTCDEAADTCRFTPDDAACDDGIDCTVDSCNPDAATSATGCAVRPDDALCTGTCITLSGGMPAAAAGLCDPTRGCTTGTATSCRDGNVCTNDRCEAGLCISTAVDGDGDGFPARSVGSATCTGGTDCDDTDGSIFPGAVERCNREDDNCNGTIDEGCVALPDDCGSAVAMTGSGGMFRATGNFDDFGNDYETPCSAADGARGGRDAVYFFDVTALSDVVITTDGGTSDTVLAVATDCNETGFALGCDDDIANPGNTSSRIFFHRIGPAFGSTSRRIYVLVDAYGSGTTGSYTVTATVTPAAADSCMAPIDISGGGTLVGQLGTPVAAIPSPSGSCQTIPFITDMEAVASFVGSSDGTQTFTALSRSFIPEVYVREGMCGTGAENACVVGSALGGGLNRAILGSTVASGTRAFLFVDNGTSSGRYTVDYNP